MGEYMKAVTRVAGLSRFQRPMGKQLRKFRQALGLTRPAMGAVFGLKPGRWRHIEDGRSAPSHALRASINLTARTLAWWAP